MRAIRTSEHSSTSSLPVKLLPAEEDAVPCPPALDTPLGDEVAACLPTFAVLRGQLAETAQEVEQAVIQVCASFRGIADRSLQGVTQASQCLDDRANGNVIEATRQTLERLLERIEQARAESRKTIAKMEEVQRGMRDIGNILHKVDAIAEGAKILAINAKIEAARAGEQGRGFAVVASEVRNLAQRSATAAKEIKGLIQDSVRKVESGSELVNRSGQSLQEIVTSMKRVTDIVSEIAAASREQSSGIDQVNKAVAQMDSVTQANASQTEELSGTAEALTGQAEQLQGLVAKFKLEDGRTAPGGRPEAASSRPAPANKIAKKPGARPREKEEAAARKPQKNGFAREPDLVRCRKRRSWSARCSPAGRRWLCRPCLARAWPPACSTRRRRSGA